MIRLKIRSMILSFASFATALLAFLAHPTASFADYSSACGNNHGAFCYYTVGGTPLGPAGVCQDGMNNTCICVWSGFGASWAVGSCSK
jgi:hypothetical protein